MLNSYYNKTESKVVAVTQVVEKTITPDKVTEMYDKILKEVEESIIKAFVVRDNYMEGAVVQIAADYLNMGSKIYTSFKLNDEQYTDYVLSTDRDLTDGQLYEKFQDHYHRIVTEKLMRDTVTEFFKNKKYN